MGQVVDRGKSRNTGFARVGIGKPSFGRSLGIASKVGSSPFAKRKIGRF